MFFNKFLNRTCCFGLISDDSNLNLGIYCSCFRIWLDVDELDFVIRKIRTGDLLLI